MKEIFNSNRNLSRSRYFRLIAIASLDIFLTLPTVLENMIVDIIQEKSFGVNLATSYPGWKIAHTQIHDVILYVGSWRENKLDVGLWYYNWSANFVLAFTYFVLFGLSVDMREKYLNLFWAFMEPLGVTPKPGNKGATMSKMRFDAGLAGRSANFNINFP